MPTEPRCLVFSELNKLVGLFAPGAELFPPRMAGQTFVLRCDWRMGRRSHSTKSLQRDVCCSVPGLLYFETFQKQLMKFEA
jgi:hypothetical protein